MGSSVDIFCFHLQGQSVKAEQVSLSLEMEEAYGSKISAALPTSIYHKHPKAELTSGTTQHENLKSVIIKAVSSRMMRWMRL